MNARADAKSGMNINGPAQLPLGCPHAAGWERKHGMHCSCRLLAAAIGITPESIDYAYCHRVLQRHWRVVCDHIPVSVARRVTREIPPHNPRDPVHVLLIANADISND
jgi:hypothetical protein